MAVIKAVFFLQIILFPVMLGSKAPEIQREVAFPDSDVSAADNWIAVKKEINRIKKILNDVSSLAENCGVSEKINQVKEKLNGVYALADNCGELASKEFSKEINQISKLLNDVFALAENCGVKKKINRIKRMLIGISALAEICGDPNFPLTWPDGTYGLPMPKSGCPSGSQETPWHEGTRYHDTEDYQSHNAWSSSFRLAGFLNINDMEQKFCMKTLANASASSLSWPKGQYCIFKKGNCPEGFSSGWIVWDDEDSSNRNTMNGTLPDGVYNHNTKIEYCCREDGSPTDAIFLPIENPFVLLKKGDQCQHVQKMKVKEMFFFWDAEDSNTGNNHGGDIPKAEIEIQHDIKLYYCYYHR